MDCSPPGSSVHGILQARIVEWVAIPFSRNLPDTRMNLVSCTVRRFFTIWAIREAPGCWCCREKRIRIPCWSRFFDSLFIVFIVILLFSHPVTSNFLWPQGLQHARPSCPSPSPEVYPSSCPLHRWCHLAISSSDILFSFCPQSFPASETFPMSQLFTSDNQNHMVFVFVWLLHLSMIISWSIHVTANGFLLFSGPVMSYSL